MTSIDITKLSITDVQRQLVQGKLSATAIAQACLERIEERNTSIHAFLAYSKDDILSQAQLLDAKGYTGLLSGIPFAVKDVIDTVDYPTTYGSAIYERARPIRDAACVALSRMQGAVLVGKVATGEFATQTPGPSRNPLNTAHTPGGSSSGSAAAVADGMVMAAWGTQTTGSIIRPAVYCGITGYKPSYGMMNDSGCGVLSPTQDTVGVLARTVEDAAAFALGIHGEKHVSRLPSSDSIVLAVCRSKQWHNASEQSVQAIEDTLQRASEAGVRIREVTLSDAFESLIEYQGKIVAFDAGRSLAYERSAFESFLSPRLLARIAAGDDVSLDMYLEMQAFAMQARVKVAELFEGVDALVYPATQDEAETGLENSGSPIFGALWSLLHLPCVAFPTQAGSGGLPLGMQMIGKYADDRRLLAVADKVSEFTLWLK